MRNSINILQLGSNSNILVGKPNINFKNPFSSSESYNKIIVVVDHNKGRGIKAINVNCVLEKKKRK